MCETITAPAPTALKLFHHQSQFFKQVDQDERGKNAPPYLQRRPHETKLGEAIRKALGPSFLSLARKRHATQR